VRQLFHRPRAFADAHPLPLLAGDDHVQLNVHFITRPLEFLALFGHGAR